MKEKPILFNTEMVKAIIEMRKTQTRRIIKPQPTTPRLSKCKYQVNDRLWVRETWACVSGHYFYKATDPDYDGKWKPSIFMPREASRLFLDVTDVRAERLQDITEEDILAEGIYEIGEIEKYYNPIDKWIELWDSINAKRGFPWSSNPWVWVISFYWSQLKL